MKLLLVEDDPIIQFIHKTMLSALQCEVDAVSSGEEALAIAKECNYDLIVLDIGLPGINGIETAVKISALEKNSKTRLIALTAHCDEDAVQKCLSAGIEKVLHKPIDIKKFESVVLGLNNLDSSLLGSAKPESATL